MEELLETVPKIFDKLITNYLNKENLTEIEKCIIILSLQNRYLIEATSFIVEDLEERFTKINDATNMVLDLLGKIKNNIGEEDAETTRH